MKETWVLLLETADAYEAYAARKFGFGPHDLVVCALSIAARRYCDARAIPYVLPESCFTAEESTACQGRSERIIQDLIAALNGHYHERVQLPDNFSFDAGTYNFFRLYQFIGALHYRCFLLAKIFERYVPERILVARDTTAPRGRFPVGHYVNCYHDLCVQSRYRSRLIVLPLTGSAGRGSPPPRKSLRTSAVAAARTIPAVDRALTRWRATLPVTFGDLISPRRRYDILVVGSPGPWRHLFADRELSRRVETMAAQEDLGDPEPGEDPHAHGVEWDDGFCGFNVAALCADEFARVERLSREMIAGHSQTLNRVGQYKALIYTVCPYPLEQYLLSIAKHLGIPRVCFQHGEMSLYRSGLWSEASELPYCSHYFTFGPEVSREKTSSAAGVDGFCAAIAVGSPALECLRGLPEPLGGYILYAASKYFDYGAGFLPPGIDSHVLSNQQKLLPYFRKLIRGTPGARVVWKMNPDPLTPKPVADSDGITVVCDEQTFVDLLPGASMVILDRPSTTSLEVCMTGIPLFVSLANRNWYPHAAELLSKRAVIAYSSEELLEAVDRFLTTGHYPADVTNREFVQAYGAHLDDGRSVERARAALMKLIDVCDAEAA